MENYPTLWEIVGENVRALRKSRGQRQADLAQWVKSYGLDWSQSTVAALEAGRRELNGGELALLCLALRERGGDDTPAQLLTGEGMVQVTPEAALSLDAVRHALAGSKRKLLKRDADLPMHRNVNWREAARRLGERVEQVAEVSPSLTWAQRDEAVSAVNDTERKAARQLDTTADVVSAAAFECYGHSLAKERDARVAESAPNDATNRTLQALRGHVTRDLVRELRPMIERSGRRSWRARQQRRRKK